MRHDEQAQADELAMLLRLVCSESRLTEREQCAVRAILEDVAIAHRAASEGFSRGSVWMARKQGLAKLRRRLAMFGFRDYKSVARRFVS